MTMEMNLSDTQRQLVESAVNEGYFEVPRQTTLVDIAAEQNLSDVEASRELRQAIDVILTEALREADWQPRLASPGVLNRSDGEG